MLKRAMPTLTAIAMLLLTSCAESAPENPAIQAEPLTAAEARELVPAVADLTAEVFKRSFAEDIGKNTLVSPLSVLLALAMTANGADGETLAEMEAALGGGIALDDLNRLLSAYANNLPSETGSKLNIANSIWFRDSEHFAVKDEFLNVNTKYYGADIKKAAFDGNTRKEINNWVSKKTDGMIKEIIEEEIPRDAIMYLINAIVFDAEWNQKYEGKDVRKRDFTAFDGRVQNTDFMRSKEYRYIETPDAVGFTKQYKGGHYSFAALLPNEDVPIADYITGTTGESLMGALNSAHLNDGGVYAEMPKFTFDYDIKMKKLLIAMGLPAMFSEHGADFSRLGTHEAGNISINEVLHKTFIEVDERGTKAAAVTVAYPSPASIPMSQPKYVTLDRPFVFAIIDNTTNLPIFIGALLEIPGA